MQITFITGNSKKFEEVEHILSDWTLQHADIDLVEIQGTRKAVIQEKVNEAMRHLNRPLIVEDVSLHCAALHGMPGPYAKDFLKAVKTEGLYELIHRCDDHRIQAVCMAAYMEPGQSPIIVEGTLEGSVVAPRGEAKYGPYSFNTIFEPNGLDKTMGEMTMVERASISHRRKAFLKLRDLLIAQGVA